MAWLLYLVPTANKAQLDQALADDQVSRQSQKVRDAASLGGPAGELYVLLEGAEPALARAETLLGPIGKKLADAAGEALFHKLKDEDEAAAAGMGLFFTEE